MKQVIMFGCVMLVANFAFAQKNAIDPSVSVNNYKQANKAAFARRHNIGNSIFLQSSMVTDGRDYKHPMNRAVIVSRGTIPTAKLSQQRGRTEKHPLGL